MQDSPNAIAQAGNLFVFVMNNPVMWRDPTGLFAIFGPDEHIIVPGGLLYQMLRESGQLPTQSQTTTPPQNRTPTTIPTTLICRPPPPMAPPPVSLTGSPGQTTFNHTDRFVSKTDTVLAFAQTYHPQSQNQEWGSWIHSTSVNGVSKYWFDVPVTGPTSVPLSTSPGATAVGWIHTHPHNNRGAGRENFSGGDINWSRHFGVPGYLVTVSGRVLKTESVSQAFYRYDAVLETALYNGSHFITVVIESIFER